VIFISAEEEHGAQVAERVAHHEKMPDTVVEIQGAPQVEDESDEKQYSSGYEQTYACKREPLEDDRCRKKGEQAKKKVYGDIEAVSVYPEDLQSDTDHGDSPDGDKKRPYPYAVQEVKRERGIARGDIEIDDGMVDDTEQLLDAREKQTVVHGRRNIDGNHCYPVDKHACRFVGVIAVGAVAYEVNRPYKGKNGPYGVAECIEEFLQAR